MTQHHAEAGVRRFKPTGKGGGSKPGKPHFKWPEIIKVIADAVVVRAKGTADAWTVDRNAPMSMREFRRVIESLLPGVWDWVESQTPNHKTDCARLLYSRVYKQFYNGTSARGKRHDPNTRASQSVEYWKNRVPEGSILRDMHQRVVRGLLNKISDWKLYL